MNYQIGTPPGPGLYWVLGLLKDFHGPMLVDIDSDVEMSIFGLPGRRPLPLEVLWAGPVVPPAAPPTPGTNPPPPTGLIIVASISLGNPNLLNYG